MDDDPMDRRTFVLGCVKAGVAGIGVAAGLGLGAPLSVRPGLEEERDPEPRTVRYLGAKAVQGPASRGIPLLPVEVEDGRLTGSPRLLGEDVLDWYKYCAHRATPGLQRGHEPATEALVYHEGRRSDPWYGHKVGEPARVEDFDEAPKGAPVTWRSQGKEGKDVVTAVLLRLDPEAVAAEGIDRTRVEAAGLEEGFLAFVTFCPYRCCVPGWKHAPRQAKPRDAWDDIFCTCCFSQFDPRAIAVDEHVLPPEGA